MDSDMGMRGDLEAVTGRWRPHGIEKSWRLPFGKGRLLYTRDQGSALRLANEQFQTHLSAVHRDGDGRLIESYDLGSGTVTNVGTLSFAADFAFAAPSGAAINTLRTANFHAVGTGSNVSSVLNVALQTLAAPTTTTAVTGVQSLIAGATGGDAASVMVYQSVATTNFVGSAAISEWGLFSNATLSSTLGSPWTSGTATSGTATGTPFTASTTTVQGQQAFVFQDNTAASPFWGMCTSNSTSVINVPAWYIVATGGVSSVNPVNADTYTVLPVLLDRQQFAAINVVSGDSVSWTFKLQIVAGG